MSQMREEAADRVRPEAGTEDRADAQFDEGFGLDDGEKSGLNGTDAKPREQSGGGQARPEGEAPDRTAAPSAVVPPVAPQPVFQPDPQPETPPEPAPEPPPAGTVDAPDGIADELEALKKLNPQAAALALEDSPEGAAVRARLEQYGAELAQDRAEQVLYRREQARARRDAEVARLEQARAAHNAAFKATLERDHPAYAAMLADPERRAEAARYQQEVFRWIEAKPYAEAAELMDIARQGRDPARVSALLSQFEHERGGKSARPDPTGALAVPGRGAPVAPTGIGDKDDFDAGWNL